MPFVAALSQHPVVAHAVGEVAGRVLERLGPGPDLVVLFAGSESTGALEDVVGAVRQLLRPVVLVGCTASSVIGDEVEVPRGGLALLAGAGFDATAVRGIASNADVVLADPFSVRADGALYASAARGPGGNRLLLDDEIFDDGAISLGLDGAVASTVSIPVADLFEASRPRPHADAALAFAGGTFGLALPEALGGAPLAGIVAAGVPEQTVTFVLLSVTGARGDPG